MVVTIDESKNVDVRKFEGDLQTGRRKVLVDDFIRSMMSLLHEDEILNYLFENDYIEVIKNFIAIEGDNLPEQVMDILIEKLKENDGGPLEKNEWFVRLLSLMLEQINLEHIEGKWLNNILSSTFKNIKVLEGDVIEFRDLLLLLVERAHVNKDLSTPALSQILKAASDKVAGTDSQEELKDLFLSIASKAEGSWIEQALSTAAPNRILHSGFFPKNVIYYHKDLVSETIVLEVPKSQLNVKYYDVDYKQVGHPGMLFYFKIQNSRIQNIKIACVKDKIIDEKTQLYEYPFSNVYSNHSVCWSYSEYEINSLQKLQHIPYIFLGTPNNSHVNPGTRELTEQFQGKEFDDEVLIASSYTFSEFVGL
ncbi:prokaryotic E2 ligase family D protein [Bacillus sp. UMB0728]|uniref:prokaryotic E2 ligase family D protein n=1 Tax=Bacillus sp. UMB0728 TaxID=2066052 RepID=UPI0021538646|nr:prokaryotic E2 ligase family D protein [Bacillus sp. UMB0728]